MNRKVLTNLLACVAIVACLVVPVARLVYPDAAGAIGALSFNAIEAVVTATLGFVLYAVLFG